MPMLTAPTPKARFIARVTRDTLEMALSVKVGACKTLVAETLKTSVSFCKAFVPRQYVESNNFNLEVS